MSEFKDKIIKEVEKIDKVISDDEERKTVMKSLEAILQDFTTHVIHLIDRQEEMEEQIVQMQEDILDLQGQMRGDFGDNEQNCPYCGKAIPLWAIDESLNEVECPSCHKIVEVDYGEDDDVMDY